MGTLAALADLVLPVDCAGCAGPGPLCAGCREVLAEVPGPVRPTPAPPGLPPCVALGPYEGVTRELILAYKERGRIGLARPLGFALGEVVGHALGGPEPVILVPIPTTAVARRARRGDHMRRLARHAVRRLRRAGVPAILVEALEALPRPDSAGLDRAQRAAGARDAFAVRPGRVAALSRQSAGVILVDDILTTGATLAAASVRLAGHGVAVRTAAVLAATRLRLPVR